MRSLKTIAASLALLCGTAAFGAVKGDYVEVRTASVFAGPCHYHGELVTTGRDAIMAWNVTSGRSTATWSVRFLAFEGPTPMFTIETPALPSAQWW